MDFEADQAAHAWRSYSTMKRSNSMRSLARSEGRGPHMAQEMSNSFPNNFGNQMPPGGQFQNGQQFQNGPQNHHMNGPGPQMNGPGPQMNGPGPQMNGPGPQMNGPPMNAPHMNGPPQQMNGPQFRGPPQNYRHNEEFAQNTYTNVMMDGRGQHINFDTDPEL